MSFDIEKYAEYAHRTALEENKFVVFDEERHAVYGLVTEASELQQAFGFQFDLEGIKLTDQELIINLIEELGDLMWYAALLCHHHKWSLAGILRNHADGAPGSSPVTYISIFSGQMIDLLKKRDAYGKLFRPEEMLVLLHKIIHCVGILISVHGLSWAKVLESNIDKLRMRYPLKFDAYKAINRDVDAELSVISTKK